MMEKTVNFLRNAFPYLLTLGLWRMAAPWWNPAGILAIIPIFYCTFVRPIPMFGLFGLVMCFLIDYQFDTVLYWTTMFCILYAINGFQNFVDLAHAYKNARDIFMIFFGVAILILFLNAPSWMNLMACIWVFLLTSVLYFPLTRLICRLRHD